MRSFWFCFCLTSAFALPCPAQETLLYDNGAFIDVAPVNTPAVGTGPGFSYRLPAPSEVAPGGDRGWPVNWLPGSAFDTAADDFTIATHFKLTRIRVFAYEANATTTARTLTGGYLRIWKEAPSGPRLGANDARIAAGFIGTGPDETDKLPAMAEIGTDPLGGGIGRSTWTGVYRRDGTYATVTDTTRPVIALDFDVSALASFPAYLTPGTYWLEVSLTGSTTGVEAWVPTHAIKGARGKEISAGLYTDAVGAGVGLTDALGRANPRPEIDFAFELYGESVQVVTCNDPFADADGDEDVDQIDFAVFQSCFTGANGTALPADPVYCACFDRDGDLNIDQNDLGPGTLFNTFEHCASGPMIVADKNCDGT